MSDRVTVLFRRIEEGDRAAGEELMRLVYGELREMCARALSRERCNHTLQATALVHEAWLKLGTEDHGWRDRRHFFSAAARAIREILIDHARGRRALKRGQDWRRLTLAEDVAWEAGRDLEILALDEALTKLAGIHERQARVAELRFLTGLGLEEVAEVVGVSARTVRTDWRVARAWLQRELAEEGPPEGRAGG